MLRAIWTTFAGFVRTHGEFFSGSLVTFILTELLKAIKLSSIAGLRQLGNKLSEMSISRLQKRIDNLKAYKNTIKSNETLDRIFHLAQVAVVTVSLISLAILSMVFAALNPPGTIFLLIGLFPCAAAMGTSLKGVQIAWLDTEERDLLVAKLTAEINQLTQKLRVRVGPAF
jgi:hypothetical protein